MGRLVQVTAIIGGMVQGVGYRWFVTRSAMKFNVTGHVANLPNGEVQVIVEGEDGIVKEFIKEIIVGPPNASVNSIKTIEGEYTGKFKGFDVEYY